MEFKTFTISKEGFFNPKYLFFEGDQLIYEVKKVNFFSLRKYAFYDMTGLKALSLERQFAFFKFVFQLYEDRNIIADFKNVGALMKNNYTIQCADGELFVEGNLFMTEFTVTKGEEEVAKISRQKFQRKNQYGLAVSEKVDSDIILGLAMMIEIIRKVKRRRRN